MEKLRRLGSAETEAFQVMKRHGGHWKPGDPPLWDNEYWTLQLLTSLSRKGYVLVKGSGGFEISPAGMSAFGSQNPSL